ncbi:MAG: hypothetical protein IPK06_09685 [Ignavibacteriae bacterium]|nr:hypothetical protein [Ignavibacteriota bacterium]
MDIEYTFTGDELEGVFENDKLKVNLEGENHVRLTLGAALKLSGICFKCRREHWISNSICCWIKFCILKEKKMNKIISKFLMLAIFAGISFFRRL